MSRHHVVIEQGSPGIASIDVDGNDVAGMVTAYTLSADVRNPATLTLDLTVNGGAAFAGQANVQVSDGTRKLLESIGWTPPNAGDDGA